MKKKELEFILQEGEGYKIEFKESLKNIDKEMVAFANSDGGKLFLGVSDDNKVKGIKVDNKLKSQIQDIANNCDPAVEVKLEEFGNILIINVKEGKNKPYKCKDGFFIRIGPNSQKMSRDKILEVASDSGKIKFDEIINKKFDYKKDFDINKLNNYLEGAGISKKIPTKKVLFELNVIEKNKRLCFNNAGVLFFAKEPQKFISHSVFSCVLFRDKEGVEIIDRREVAGNLIEIVEEVMKFMKKNIRVAYKFTGKPQRENVYEYPLEAIREAVINSVMHRDYFERGHNNILRIFPDNLTITNVWSRPSWFKIGRDTFRRNKIIADLFSRLGMIEKIGSGFARMKSYCQKVRAPIFKLDLDEKYFRIIFLKSRDYLELAKGVTEELGIKLGIKLGINEEKILGITKKNKFITSEELSKITNISTTAVDNNILKLKQKGLLKRVGSRKSGYWKIIKRGRRR